MTQSDTITAEESLSKDRPWNPKSYIDSSPPGWVYDNGNCRWNQPPEGWRFDGWYWVQLRTCRFYLKNRCKFGSTCRFFHPNQPISENTEQSNDATRGNQSPDIIISQNEESEISNMLRILQDTTDDEDGSHDDDEVKQSTGSTEDEDDPGSNEVSTSQDDEAKEAVTSRAVTSPDAIPLGQNPSGETLPEEKEAYGHVSLQAAIDNLNNFDGFKEVAKDIAKLQRQTEVYKAQGIDLKTECRSRSIALLDVREIDCDKATELFHNYLKAAGYFSGQPEYTQVTAASGCCDRSCCKSCVKDELDGLSSGTLLVKNADNLCDAGKKDLSSIWENESNLTLILASKSTDYSESLGNFLPFEPLQLRLHSPTTQLELGKKAFLEAIEERFEGKMKLEGGPDGPSVLACVRNLLESFDVSEDIKDVVKSALEKICSRQINRLCASADDMSGSQNGSPHDVFLLTTEDLNGIAPDISNIQLEEWQELQSLVGLDPVKSSLQSHMNGLLLDYYLKLNCREPLQLGHSKLFLGPAGTGKTTVATLYGKILAKLGVLSCGKLVLKNASDFIGQYIGDSLENTKKILKEAQGNVLLIDEAYMLNAKRNHNCPYRREVVDTIVGEVQNKPGDDICVIMCGYKEEMEAFIRDANPGLQRRFPLKDAFVFEDFGENALGQILDLKMSKQGLRASERGRAAAMSVLRLAKQRPNFGNGGEIDNLLSRAITNFRNRFGSVPAEMRFDHAKNTLLLEDDFDPENLRSLHAEDEVDHQFHDFVGLGSQVEEFRLLARRVKAMRKHNVDPKPYIPFRFVFKGPPGSGKTTFARKMGKIFYQMGLLATSDIVEASVQDMIAGYIGQTVTKTQNLLKSALGKVLLIDEAHRLKGGGSGCSYTAEARDELVDAITKPQFFNKLVIILVGYDSQMDAMLQCNPGLSSRFRNCVQFRALPGNSCTQLLKKKIEQSGIKVVLGKHEAAIHDTFETLMSTNGWGNGRDVESMAIEVVGKTFEIITDNSPLILNGSMIMEVMHDWCFRLGVSVAGRVVEDENPLASRKQSEEYVEDE